VAILIFAAAGGTSGAGIHIPMFVGLYHFGATSAIGLSNVILTMGGIVRYFKNIGRPHPSKNGKGTIIDFTFCTLGLPAAITGSSLGTIANLVLPETVVLVLFIIVVGYTVVQVCKQYSALRKSENVVKAAQNSVEPKSRAKAVEYELTNIDGSSHKPN